jgi:hypothetical protein
MSEKKIIVDEDWKSQVQAEKEALKQKPAADQAAAPQANSDDPPWPPASFELLLTTLITEAMMSLGQIPHPMTGTAQLRPNQARYFIDTIELLYEKTKGNLDSAEEQALDNALHQLRLAYLAVGQMATPATDSKEQP